MKNLGHKCINCDNEVVRDDAIRCKVCANRFISINRKKRIEPVGKDRWNFKGFTYQYGYKMMWNPEHHRSNSKGYVMNAILVIEEKIGRKIEENEVVHHKNEDRSDDRLENLQLMTDHDHKFHHIKKNKPSRGMVFDRDVLGRFTKTYKRS